MGVLDKEGGGKRDTSGGGSSSSSRGASNTTSRSNAGTPSSSKTSTSTTSRSGASTPSSSKSSTGYGSGTSTRAASTPTSKATTQASRPSTTSTTGYNESSRGQTRPASTPALSDAAFNARTTGLGSGVSTGVSRMGDIAAAARSVTTGLSPHNVGLVTPVAVAKATDKAAATARGARFVERYLTPLTPNGVPSEGAISEAQRRIDRSTYGPRLAEGPFGGSDRGARLVADPYNFNEPIGPIGPGRGLGAGGELIGDTAQPTGRDPYNAIETSGIDYLSGPGRSPTGPAAPAAAPTMWSGPPGWPSGPRPAPAPSAPSAPSAATTPFKEPVTRQEIIEFQRANGLKPDGIKGPLTQRAIEVARERPVPIPEPAPRGLGGTVQTPLPADMDPRIYGPGEIAPGPVADTTAYLPEFRGLTPAEGPIPEAATRAATSTAAVVPGYVPTREEIIERIKEGQRIRGITGDVPLNIAMNEGLNTTTPADGWQSNITNSKGVREDSFGPFQLKESGGLGAEFEKETGLDLRNPETALAQVDWALNYMAENGTSKWSAATKLGYDRWEGMRDAKPAPATAAVDPMTTRSTTKGLDPGPVYKAGEISREALPNSPQRLADQIATNQRVGGSPDERAAAAKTQGLGVALPEEVGAGGVPTHSPKVPDIVTFQGKPMSQQTYDALGPETRDALYNLAYIEGGINLNSASRSKSHNEAVGGVGGSQHLVGRAVDWDISGKSKAEKTQAVINARQAGWNRIGAYGGQGALHLDMAPGYPPPTGYDVHPMYNKSVKNMSSAPAWFEAGLKAPIDRQGTIAVAGGGGDVATPETITPATSSTVPASTTAAKSAAATSPQSAAQQAGVYSNITQRAPTTALKPTVPPRNGEYKRGLGGNIGAGVLDMLVGGSGVGLVMQGGALLLTGDTVGGNVVDRTLGGKPNYYQPGSLDRQSDSSGEQVRTDATRNFTEKYLTSADTATASTPAPVVAEAEVAALPFHDPTVRPTPAEKWGPMNTWARSYV